MDEPLISILTPFKNTEKYLTECLNSIGNQTYVNWELLIIDDGSTDGSYELVKSYANKDVRVKLFKNKGSGIIEALRLAFDLSKGRFITRMDSDDIMKPNKLEVLSNLLLTNGRGHIAIGNVKYFSSVDISDGYDRYEKWLNQLTSQGNNYTEIYKECVIPSPCWMMFKEDLIEVDAFHPNRYPEDYDLTFRCYEKNIKCIPCRELLHLWRDYATRTSRTHVHYAQNYFLDIKLHYFLKLDHDSSRPLAVWGAGFKGKTIAKALVNQNIPFYWICDNPKKIGKHIYDQELLPFDYLRSLHNAQSIITVANEDAQKEIKYFLNSNGMHPMTDYFFFC